MAKLVHHATGGDSPADQPAASLRPAQGPAVSAQEGIWITNADFATTFVNARVAALLGYRADEIVGHPLTDFVDPLTRDVVDSMLRRLPTGVSDQREIHLLRRDGTPLFAVLESRALFTTESEFKGVRAALVDVTPRRIAEEHLRRREVQLAQAQAMARLGSWEWDLDTGLMTSSDGLFQLLQREPHGPWPFAQAMTAVEVEDKEQLLAHLQAAATGDEPVEYKVAVRTGQGERRTMQVRAQRVRDSAGRATRVVGVVQDITERKSLEERLQQAERVSSLGRLAASVAHEFNNILMGIQPFAEVILRNSAADPRLYEAAARIADGVSRGKRVTQEILRFTRTPEPVSVVVDVAAWLSAGYTDLVQLAGGNIPISIEAETEMRMLADPLQLRQVFANFVTNARDAMPQGGTITIRAMRQNGRRSHDAPELVHFTVADNGVGMSPETIRMAFEPLFTTKHIGGTGLGLAVAREIVQRHGGQIWVESALGLGSTFHLLIPAAAAEAAPAVPAPEPLRETGEPLRKVALIEDDPAVAAGLLTLLEMDGIEVDLIERGLDAIPRIDAFTPDAVVLDVGLPDVSGITVYGEIARRWPSLPVLFSTGHGDEKLLTNVLGRPNVGYLLKPYDSTALLGAIAKLRRR
jgi:PAS domain S-box-containing protein